MPQLRGNDPILGFNIWAYRTTRNKLIRHNPFRLMYGQEAMMAMDLIISSLRIVAIEEFTYSSAMEKRLLEVVEFEED